MVLDFTTKKTAVIVYFILTAINITYYNPILVSIVEFFQEFCFLFLEHQFLYPCGILKPVLSMKSIFVNSLTFVNG